MDAAGPLGLVVVGVFLLALALMTAMRLRMSLLACYLLLLMFSGFAVESIDAGSTLLRWLVMFLIAATCFAGVGSPGGPALMLGLYAVVGGVTAPIAPSSSLAIQRSGLLLIIALPMAAAVADRLRTMEDVLQLLKVFIVAGGLYVVLGLLTLPSLTAGERFAGVTTSAPLFVLTGGLLLPVALWGALQPGIRQWRVYCVFIAVCTGMLCLISGQRTGTLAGFIGCLPLLARFGVRKVLISLLLLAVGLGLVYAVLSAMPAQEEFVRRRFFSADTTGRVERWTTALSLCLQRPFLGHGAASSADAGFGFHNAYLVTWYELGVVGVLLFAGAFLWMAFRAARLILHRADRRISDIARLLLGVTLANMAAAFFESKLISPSNIAIFTAVVTSAVLVRLGHLAGRHPAEYAGYDIAGDEEAAYGEGYGPWPGPSAPVGK